jgi:hypothetical protein
MAALLIAGTACSATVQDKNVVAAISQHYVPGIVARTASPAVQQAAGAKLAHKLSCKVAGGASSAGLPVTCTDTTVVGKPVRLTGTVKKAANSSAGDYVKGTFTVTAGGRTVLQKSCFGRC